MSKSFYIKYGKQFGYAPIVGKSKEFAKAAEELYSAKNAARLAALSNNDEELNIAQQRIEKAENKLFSCSK